MSKLKIRHKGNFKLRKSDIETPKGVSITQVGETYTIQELIAKHTRGILPMHISKEPVYDDEPTHDSLDREKFHRSDIELKNEVVEQQRNIFHELEEKAKPKEKPFKKAPTSQAETQGETQDENDVRVQKSQPKAEQNEVVK